MRAVLIFARSPEREALAKGLPLAQAALLFRRHVARWLEAAHAAEATPVIACTDEDRGSLATVAPALTRQWITQRGAHFGQRLSIAAADAFALGFESLVIASIDAPPVKLDAPFAALESGRVVIAPSTDGGVNLLGITVAEVDLLATIAPRQRDLVAICRARFPRLTILAAADDVDDEITLRAIAGKPLTHVDAPRARVTSGIDRDLPPRAPPSH